MIVYKILIIDDEPGICATLKLALEGEYDIQATTDPMHGISLITNQKFNVCLLDLKIGKYDGINVLKEIKKIDKDLVVIIITSYGSIDSSVEAIKSGAYTYMTKPINLNNLYHVISQALEYQRLNEKVEYLSQKLEEKFLYDGIVGISQSMKQIYDLIETLKEVDTNVLITGESGTGKELVAKALHFSGKRKKEKFVVLNCAAIPEGLLEEEMFGHKKGSFTGATEDKKGKFEIADGGTIFLDEIGDMNMSLQSKLLRVIQQREFFPIGGSETKKIDVRIISATNKDLKSMVDEGTFRQDLYFRLNVVEIKVPSLRERKQDLPLLFNYYIQKYNKELNRNVKGVSKEVENVLIKYDYPGNIRELSNIFENMIVFTNSEIIEIENVPKIVREYKSIIKNTESFTAESLIGMNIKEIEKIVIKLTLQKNGNSRKITADMLGISERGLRNKILEYGLK